MHSFLSRLNAVFAFTLSTLASVTFPCFVSTFFKNYSTAVEIDMAKPYMELDVLNAILNFDLQVGLSPLFDWNTKQLFLFSRAEYAMKENVVLWDKIVLWTDKQQFEILLLGMMVTD
uniref:Signal peptidase complex subunit 3 n=1 Tax=Romanomermis culicivorax TaxID=13658 RepID=A0A915IN19_ROMCU